MDTLRKLSAFGITGFVASVFSVTQPLGAEPTCFCSPEDGLLPAMIVTFNPAGVDLRDICDTHPVADQGFTPDSTDLSVIALNFTPDAFRSSL